MFWVYLIFQFSRVAVEAIFYCVSYRLYFYSYWTASACGVIFDLLLRCIFLTVLEGCSPLNRLRRSGYEVALLSFWTLALFLTYHNVGGRTVPQLIYNAEVAVSFVAVGMFVFVVASSAVLGIHWTLEICGIALGVGLSGIADLAVYAALSHGHRVSTAALSWIETLTYDCAIGVFAFCFVPKRKVIQRAVAFKPEWVQWLDGIKGALSERSSSS